MRVRDEVVKQGQGGKDSIVVQKCLNILKATTGKKDFTSTFYEDVEKAFLLLFEFMADPTKINFADDILVILKNFIRRTGKVSDNVMKVFFTLDNLFK